MDRTIALDNYRSQNFLKTLPEIAEPIYAYLKRYLKALITLEQSGYLIVSSSLASS